MKKLEGKWLVAVSSGSDSMALLHLCLDADLDIAAAHVNYHHRIEADEEEAYVRSFCKAHGIDCFVQNEPFTSFDNFEADAREWRYDFFAKIVKENGMKGVLIAHQEDDVLETYLMQEEKHIIPAYYGLKEESMYKGILVKRPLLTYTRKQLQDICKDNSIQYYTDSTNLSDTYARNRIRHTYVEPMTSYERQEILHEIAKKNAVLQERRCRVKTMVTYEGTSLKQYRSLSQEDRDALLRTVLEEDTAKTRMSLAYIREIDHILCTKNDFVIALKEKELVQDHGFFFLHIPYQNYKNVYRNEEEMQDTVMECYRIQKGTSGTRTVHILEEEFPVTIRNFQDGDMIQMRFGRKAVHRFFIDRHIPLYLRRTWPVVLNRNNQIIAVPGLGCDMWHYSVISQFDVIEYETSGGE